MSDDIVTRLRNAWDDEYLCCLGCSCAEGEHEIDCLTLNAADEIERLREIAEKLSIELSRHEHQSLPCKGTVDCECGVSQAQHLWGFGQAVRGE